MGNITWSERFRIQSVKGEILRIKQDYSSQIASLKKQCQQIGQSPINAGVLSSKIKKDQEKKREEMTKEIKRLENELEEKLAPLEKELKDLQQGHPDNSKNKGSKSEAKESTKKTPFYKKHKIITIVVAFFALQLVAAGILSSFNREVDFEEYDLKGLTVKEACEKARGAGWKVDRVVSIEGDDKTDCYNETILVTDYDYYRYGGEVEIYFGEKKSEEQKKAECEATGKWYRDRACKSQEEWENEYAWKNAHAACKKYGSSGYAKTLTDCYVGNQYMGPVDGQPTSEPAEEEPQPEPESAKEEPQTTENKPVEETPPATSQDDPTKMPEDELSTAIVVCKRVIKQTYGIDVKTTEYARSYWYGEDYVWLISFMNGRDYRAVTCQYNWKTGGAVSNYINW